MAKAKAVETQEHFEISWDDDGNRRHQLAFNPNDAQEVARGFVEDHELNDVAIHKVTTTIEPIELKKGAAS